MVFAIAMDPKKIGTMMDELEELTGEQRDGARSLDCDGRIESRKVIVLGRDRLKAINKRVGERINFMGLITKTSIWNSKSSACFRWPVRSIGGVQRGVSDRRPWTITSGSTTGRRIRWRKNR